MRLRFSIRFVLQSALSALLAAVIAGFGVDAWLKGTISDNSFVKNTVEPLIYSTCWFHTKRACAEFFVKMRNARFMNGDMVQAIDAYDQALRLDPTTVGISSILTEHDTPARLDDETKAKLAEAISGNPKDARGYLIRGLAYASRNDVEAAISDFTAGINLDGKYTLAYLLRGRAFASRKANGDYDRAILDFESVTKLNPRIADAYYFLATVYSYKNQEEKALDSYNKAIIADPKFIAAYFARGTTYTEFKQYNLAIADLDEAIKLADPIFYEAAYINRGDAYHKRGKSKSNPQDYELAIKDFEAVIRHAPIPIAYFNRAYVYMDRNNAGDAKLAMVELDEAIRLKPSYAEAYLLRSELKSRIKDSPGAEQDYRAACRLLKGPDWWPVSSPTADSLGCANLR